MTVVTDHRRYVFELVVAGPKASTTDLAVVVRFLVPPPRRLRHGCAVDASRRAVVRNSAYAVKGDAALQPTKIFDDGAATYFAWPRQVGTAGRVRPRRRRRRGPGQRRGP
ncbi:TrbG/VirB9 family P-type conjugative transfer protein [Caulobacter segnis]